MENHDVTSKTRRGSGCKCGFLPNAGVSSYENAKPLKDARAKAGTNWHEVCKQERLRAPLGLRYSGRICRFSFPVNFWGVYHGHSCFIAGSCGRWVFALVLALWWWFRWRGSDLHCREDAGQITAVQFCTEQERSVAPQLRNTRVCFFLKPAG